MNLSSIVRTLALGSMLALAVITVPAVHVHADGKDEGPTLDCLNQGTGEWTLSGQVDYAKDSNGKTHALGCDDGKWVDLGVVGASRAVAPVRPIAPHPAGSALSS